jgi:hypothetical protein
MIAKGERVSGAACEDGVGVDFGDCSFTVFVGLSGPTRDWIDFVQIAALASVAA